MKKYFLFLLALLLFTTSCKKCGDCMYSCDGFYFTISIRDKETGFDATGDNFDTPYVKYLLDSIKYQVITQMDTSKMLTPSIIRSEWNTIKISYTFSAFNIIDATGSYLFVIHLDDQDRDTVKVIYQHDSEVFQMYQNDSLVGNLNCGFSPSLNFIK